jgi:hypothetical protein
MDRNKRIYWLLSLALLIGTILAKVIYLNGSILGLDYGLFHPDGAYYSFKTLTVLGNSQDVAGQLVSNFYNIHAVGNPIIDPNSLHFTSGVWETYQLRLLYPLLSVPFVALLGLWGMLVIPIVCFVSLWFFATYALRKNFRIGLVALLVLSSSLTVSRWMFANVTDALLVGLFVIYLLFLPKVNKSSFVTFSLFHFSVIALTSLTRFVFLLWVAIAIAYMLEKSLKKSFFILVFAFLGFLPNLFIDFYSAVTPDFRDDPLLSKLLAFPLTLLKMHIVEFGQLFVIDRVFFFALILLLGRSLFEIRKANAQLILLVTSALVLTASINGVLGVNFRFHLPLLPFLIYYLSSKSVGDFRLKR